MKKPSFASTIAIYVALTMLYFTWSLFLELGPQDETKAFYSILFFGILIYTFFQKWKAHNKAMETFIAMITTMGKRERIVDYRIMETENNGAKNYVLLAEVNAFGEKKKVRQPLSRREGQMLQKSKQALDLYYDATNSSKFVYYVKIPEITQATLDA